MSLRRGDIVHAVPIGRAIGEHRASSTCWCYPVLLYRDLESTAAIWVHSSTARPSAALVDEYGAHPQPSEEVQP